MIRYVPVVLDPVWRAFWVAGICFIAGVHLVEPDLFTRGRPKFCRGRIAPGGGISDRPVG